MATSSRYDEIDDTADMSNFEMSFDDDTFDASSVDSSTTRVSSRSALKDHSSTLFINERSDFFTPPELVPDDVEDIDPHAYQYWLRVGTMCRQLLLVSNLIGTKRKQGKVYQVCGFDLTSPAYCYFICVCCVLTLPWHRLPICHFVGLSPSAQTHVVHVQYCFYGVRFIEHMVAVQVVETEEAAIALGKELLRHCVITEMYGTREFKNKKKIYRFSSDHTLLHFDGAAIARIGGKIPINMNPAVFKASKRFVDGANLVVAKIREILSDGPESVSARRLGAQPARNTLLAVGSCSSNFMCTGSQLGQGKGVHPGHTAQGRASDGEEQNLSNVQRVCSTFAAEPVAEPT